MARILAIDYGKTRVGLAVTDPLKIVANPLTTVKSKEALDYVKDYCKKEDVETLNETIPTPIHKKKREHEDEASCHPIVNNKKKKLKGWYGIDDIDSEDSESEP